MWNRVFKVVLFAALLAGIMQAIRLLLIEPDGMARACAMDASPWFCWLRALVVAGFAHHLYGPISLVAALLAWVSGLRVLAALAMLSGMAGMVLYTFDIAAMGFVLGALQLTRADDEAPVLEQQTHADQAGQEAPPQR